MKFVVLFVVACVANAGVLPPGLSEPLTKIAEQMARGKSMFAAKSSDEPITLRVEEPLKQSSEFQKGVREVLSLQRQQLQALAKLSGKASFLQEPQFNVKYEFPSKPSAWTSFVADVAAQMKADHVAFVAVNKAQKDDVLDVFRKVAGGSRGDAPSLSEYVQQQIAKVKDIQARVQFDQEHLRSSLKEVATDKSASCGAVSGMSCGNLQRASNACNYARMGSEFAYQQVNKVVNGLGRVVSSMCGCVMVGNKAECSLAQVPEVCGFPYQAYSALYGSSQSMWELVKSTTLQCKVIGDPAVASR